MANQAVWQLHYAHALYIDGSALDHGQLHCNFKISKFNLPY